MTAPHDTPNVVDLQQRQAGAAGVDRLGGLLKQVRGVSLKRINGLVGTLFENVDDALFDLAERAGSNALQTEYFDGMREVRKKRQLVERLFLEQAARAFGDFAEGRLKPVKLENPQPGSGGLSLVDNVELEEALAVTSMVAKAENRLQRTLYQVNQRLAVLIGGTRVDDASNPIGPAMLGNAFRVAMREFEVNVQVKLIVYKLFDRYVMAGLEPVYEEVNIELIRAGVLPQVRHSYASSGHAAPPSRPPGGHYDAAGEGRAQSVRQEAATSELQEELYQTLRSLLASRHVESDGRPAAAGEEGPASAGLSATDLISALSILQSQSSAARAREAELQDTAAAVQQIKRELLDQAGKLSDGARRRVSNADEDTIDLVGMLFEYIVQDRNLPARIQSTLSRLQIPYLKVAILDRHLFAQRAHPARRLLDTLADAGKSWTEESDRDQRLYKSILAAVEAVLRDFDDDMDIFERELATFNRFIEQNQKRSELAEQRATDATRGREKLQEARRVAASEILKRIDQRELPPIVHTVLSRPWANYLVLTLLRQGEDSEEWRNALRFADEFVWSALPKKNDSELARLRSLLPHLEKALRHGLATVAYHESDVRQVMQQLGAFYRRILEGQSVELRGAKEVIEDNVAAVEGSDAAAATTAETPGMPAMPAATRSPVEEIVLSSEPSVSEQPAEALPADDEYVKTVRELKVGSWIEFVDEDEHRERCKLSWISPISGKYLFVNRRGLKVCDKTVAALVVELRRGSAVLLEEVPLFDRALDAIVARLRGNEDSKPGPAPASPGPAA
ncbi:DUF1631 domain-containing protein [Dokdonella sp.]|uniref:DUF1631 domain-containing protein n=1 Tax=Dokdonella sp. TaxID=2291710 RepID=UPI0031C0FF9F|nr:DUF1631 domain-containing protein [Dokdonella sp.]